MTLLSLSLSDFCIWEVEMLKGCKPILFVAFFFGLGAYSPRQSTAATAKQETTQPASREKAAKPRAAKSVVYKNKKYGFSFSLPGSWKGYSIRTRNWGGGPYDSHQTGPGKLDDGPTIWIRHPLSTEANPRQDIPIMIFTHAQWGLVEEGKLIVSAAPVGPSEIGRNARYVFALPPRYNYASPEGWEEVEEILQHNPLRAL